MPPDEHPSNALVTEHIAVVGHEVRSLAARLPAHVNRDDLTSAGLLALVRAARAYDPGTGVPFNRYAAMRIRGALIDELRGQDWAPRQARQRATRVTRATTELTASLGRTPTDHDVAEHLSMTPDQVTAARSVSEVQVLSMDAGPDESSLVDSVPDAALGPEGSLLVGERQQYLHAAVAALPDTLRQVVVGIFFEGRPAAELAAEIGVTQSRVSQLRTEAMALMRDGMNAHLDPELVPAPRRADGVVERRRQAYYARVATHAAEAALVVLPTQRDPRARHAVA
ncbi:sigma-70 family RNA polymerase sigma factor [Cellulomonas sp. ATA003]|uniref:sigma-70 family RNA polymerase sigma factor n=1 Tax=Cellulomonas sp. ATA003 TaxID=3073064 RepID=UPI002873AA36|nr:sigma-70 family RNA polymerase sigma factor [Cellulomonas sp. ATA003]WNB86841.1 sigma-70 family RNA polymerase sigma factor [Cellulomonas sp. ATA003]